jgi:hypothetical protein
VEKAPDWPPSRREYLDRMRAMFAIWVVLIVAGIVFFSIVGLSHR